MNKVESSFDWHFQLKCKDANDGMGLNSSPVLNERVSEKGRIKGSKKVMSDDVGIENTGRIQLRRWNERYECDVFERDWHKDIIKKLFLKGCYSSVKK